MMMSEEEMERVIADIANATAEIRKQVAGTGKRLPHDMRLALVQAHRDIVEITWGSKHNETALEGDLDDIR